MPFSDSDSPSQPPMRPARMTEGSSAGAPGSLLDVLLEAVRAFLESEQWQSAERTADQALAVARDHELRFEYAEVLYARGRARKGQENKPGAHEDWVHSLQLQEDGQQFLRASRTACELAILHRSMGETEAARRYARQALQFSASEKPGVERARALEQLGILERRSGEFASAQDRFEEAMRIYESLDDVVRAAGAREKLGNTLQNLGRHQEAMDCYERCLVVYEQHADKARLAAIHNNLAGLFHELGRTHEAVRHFERARDLFDELKRIKPLAVTLGNLGFLHLQMGNGPDAERMLRDALQHLESIGDRTSQPDLLNNLAVLHLVGGRFEDVLTWADRALDLYRELDLREGLAKPLHNRVLALLQLDRADEADRSFEEARMLAAASESSEARAEFACLEAEMHLFRADLEHAESAAREAYSLSSPDHPPHAAEALRVLGAVHRRQGLLESAREFLQRAITEYPETMHPYREGLCELELGQLFNQIGAHEAAAQQLRAARQRFIRFGNERLELLALVALAESESHLSSEGGEILGTARDLAERLSDTAALRRLETLERISQEGPALDVPQILSRTRSLESALRDVDGHSDLAWKSVSDAMRGPGVVSVRIRLDDGTVVGDTEGGPKPQTDPQCWLEVPLGGGKTSGVLQVLLQHPATDGDRLFFETAVLLIRMARQGGASAAVGQAGVVPEPPRLATSGARATPPSFHGLIGVSRKMRDLFRIIAKVAPTTANVLIEGESGTGKELAARAVHDRSGRAGAFVAINCPSFPESLIESELFGYEKGAFTGATHRRAGQVELADGGTLFLDEVGDMTQATQTKLLRFLETREFLRVGGRDPVSVDVRVVAATSRNLTADLASGRFREDLYHRLKVVPLLVPALRDRTDDLRPLLEGFCSELAPGLSFTDPAMAALSQYAWPGNVRELRNLVQRMAVVHPGETVNRETLPEDVVAATGARSRSDSNYAEALVSGESPLRPGETLTARLLSIEGALIRSALQRYEWNQSQTARSLGLTESTLRAKMSRFGIRRPKGSRRSGRKPGPSGPDARQNPPSSIS